MSPNEKAEKEKMLAQIKIKINDMDVPCLKRIKEFVGKVKV